MWGLGSKALRLKVYGFKVWAFRVGGLLVKGLPKKPRVPYKGLRSKM